MELSPSGGADIRSAAQEIRRLLWTSVQKSPPLDPTTSQCTQPTRYFRPGGLVVQMRSSATAVACRNCILIDLQDMATCRGARDRRVC